MRSASLRHSSGPGSSITLTAETIKIRDKVIERFIDKPLAELTAFLNQALDGEMNEDRRLGLIAARIYILRHRVDHVKDYNRDPSIEPMQEPTPRSMLAPQADAVNDEPDEDSAAEVSDTPAHLSEVITIETGEINGVRIPAGITITVNKEDADRLIENGKAELVIKQETAASQPAADEAQAPEAPTIKRAEIATAADMQELETLAAENEAADIGDPGASPIPTAADEELENK